jgi:hypothetical protein
MIRLRPHRSETRPANGVTKATAKVDIVTRMLPVQEIDERSGPTEAAEAAVHEGQEMRKIRPT